MPQVLRASICIFVAFAALTAPVLAVEVTGTWKLDVELAVGSGTATFALRQEGEEITGTYQGALGEAQVTGNVKGSQIEFSFTTQGIEVRYQGKVADRSMDGTCEYGDQASGTFKGKRQ